MIKTQKQPVLSTVRSLRNKKVIWYGPHECSKCGAPIVKSSHESGGVELDAPHDHHYPNHVWKQHGCGKEVVIMPAPTV